MSRDNFDVEVVYSTPEKVCREHCLSCRYEDAEIEMVVIESYFVNDGLPISQSSWAFADGSVTSDDVKALGLNSHKELLDEVVSEILEACREG